MEERPDPTPAEGAADSALAAVRSLWYSPSVDHRIREMFWPHSLRVTVLVRRLAERCGVAVSTMELAALAHDLGMTGIYSGILLKPDVLDALERGFIRAHVHSGAWICRDLLDEPAAAEIVLHHHERWDGAGYPHGLPADETPLGARLLAVPDVFDTLAFEQRPYQDRIFTVDAALGELQGCAGSQFDPEMVDEFVLLMTEEPDLHEPEGLVTVGDELLEAALEAADEEASRPGSFPDPGADPKSAGGGTA